MTKLYLFWGHEFLEKERTTTGWRFWLLFVIATNLGFFLGLGIEYLIFGAVNIYIGMILSGVGQSWVLSRHFPERGQWAIASAIGWLVGGRLSSRTLAVLMPDISFAVNLFVFPIIAGIVMGIPQWWVLRRYLPNVGLWWVLVPAIGTVIQFPGAIMGGVMVWLMNHQHESEELERLQTSRYS